jgi:hypothetical protein
LEVSEQLSRGVIVIRRWWQVRNGN